MALTEIIVQFNECINARDINGLASLMSEDHAFIDSENSIVRGKAASLDAWRGFFAQFPDYRNHFKRFISGMGQVTVVGHSTCSEPALDGPALWKATVKDGKVTEWRVYEDTPENRATLGIADEG